MHFTILFGSYRSERAGIRAVQFIEKKLSERGHDCERIDAKAVNLPILDRMYKEYASGEAPVELERVAGILRKSDGFIVVAGEYNHSIQPGLKNLLDHFLEEYLWRPSAVVSYSAGGFGGVRVAVHLRAVLAELGTSSIPTTLTVPKISQAFSEDGTPEDDRMNRRAGKFLDELEWYALALKNQREVGLPR